MNKPKVVIVTNIPSPYRVDLFYYMQTHMTIYDIHIIYTNISESNRLWSVNKEKLLQSHILHSKIIRRKRSSDTEYIHLATGVIRELSSIGPDIVIAFEYNLAALETLCWCKLHHKSFIHLTDGTLHSEKNISGYQKLSRHIIIKNSDAYIASSTKAKEKLLSWGAPEDKILVSFLTVDTTPYLKLQRSPESGRILYVGRITKGKRLDLLIQALPYLHTNYCLRIVGDGDEAEINQLKEMADKYKVSDKIIWCGFKKGESLFDEYRKADVFVFPSCYDCFGLVLVEALCAGLPIVVSKYADGAYDIVKDGVNGFIVDPHHSERFAQALELAKNKQLDPKFMNCMASHFSFASVIKGYHDALQMVLKF